MHKMCLRVALRMVGLKYIRWCLGGSLEAECEGGGLEVVFEAGLEAALGIALEDKGHEVEDKVDGLEVGRRVLEGCLEVLFEGE